MKKLFRSNSDKMVAGVLGGLGQYFKVDATILRLGFVILLVPSFLTFAIIYLIAAVVIPSEEDVY